MPQFYHFPAYKSSPLKSSHSSVSVYLPASSNYHGAILQALFPKQNIQNSPKKRTSHTFKILQIPTMSFKGWDFLHVTLSWCKGLTSPKSWLERLGVLRVCPKFFFLQMTRDEQSRNRTMGPVISCTTNNSIQKDYHKNIQRRVLIIIIIIIISASSSSSSSSSSSLSIKLPDIRQWKYHFFDSTPFQAETGSLQRTIPFPQCLIVENWQVPFQNE